MTFRTTGALLIMAAVLVTGCNSDKVVAGRRLLETEPEKAIALFKEAEKERGECFECLIYTGLAYEKLGSESHALTTYERAIAMAESAGRPEPVAERLLVLYEKAHGKATGDEKLKIARQAAQLEKSLKVARPWASMYLLETLSADMKKAAENGHGKAVREIADECMNLALPAEMKNGFAVDATHALQSAFVVASEKKFKETLAAPLAEKGLFDPESGNVVMSNEFDIPSKKEGAAWDPDSPGFWGEVRKGACLPLYEQMDEILKMAAPVLGLKGIEKAPLNLTFQDLYKKAEAGFTKYGGDKRAPNGQSYLCRIQVPLKEFLSAIFRFAE